MSVKIQWTQRTAGRYPGDQEIVELTPFVQGCLDHGRIFIVQEPIVGFGVEPVSLTRKLDDQPLGD